MAIRAPRPISQVERDFYPLRNADAELRAFRCGEYLGPLTKIAMSLHDEWQREAQLDDDYDDARVEYPHYPLPPNEVEDVIPIRDKFSGEVIRMIRPGENIFGSPTQVETHHG